MKMKSILIYCFLFICYKTNAQCLSIAFFEKFKNISFEKTNDILMENGYSFSDSYKIGNSTAYSYTKEKIKDGFTSNSITIEINVNDKCRQVLFQYNKDCFLKIKSLLKKSNYKFSSTENEQGKISFSYYNSLKQTYCIFTQTTTENRKGNIVEDYHITFLY